MNMKGIAKVVLIGDVVGSRQHADRRGMQRELEAVLESTNAAIPAVQPLAPTIGDEFQAAFADVQTAVVATLRLRLGLPEELDCRFGLGAGTYERVGRSQYGVMQDGPAWWAARDAIVIAKNREKRKNKTLRTWYAVAESGEDDMSQAGFVNALLLCRDQIVSDMNARQRRLLLGLLDGRTQAALAASEGVSESAVSQTLQSSGAFAVLAAHETLTGAAS
jgi:hypothetical protein